MAVTVVIDSLLWRRRKDPTFISTAGDRWTPPWWPQESDNDEYGRIWTMNDRPQRRPLPRHEGDGLHRVGLELRVWRDGASIEGDLQAMRKLAANGYPVRIEWAGPSHLGWWHVERPSWPILQCNEAMEAIDARVSMTLRRAETLGTISPISSVSPGDVPVRPRRPALFSSWTADGSPLSVVAHRAYGDPERWREIADANGIVNPALITPGQVLKVPA